MSDQPPLIRWLAGRRELWPERLDGVVAIDPWQEEQAPFFDRLRELDRLTWCEPLGRVRPSWVFYDCVLVPGVSYGYATRDARGALHPVSMLALIPTLFGVELVQSLGATDGVAKTADELIDKTLREGAARLFAERLCVTLPWSAPLLSSLSAVGPLAVMTAWTPAHDEERSVTFELSIAGTPSQPHGARTRIDPRDDGALIALQHDIEAGAQYLIHARDAASGELLIARSDRRSG